MAFVLSSLEVEPATSTRYLHPPTSELELDPFSSGLELDPFCSGLELDRNVSSLEPISVDYGPESTPAECLDENAPQLLFGIEDKEVVERKSPAGSTVQEPNEDLPRKKPWLRLVGALILFMVLIAIIVPVSVTQTRNTSLTTPSRASNSTNFSSPQSGDYSTSGAFKTTGLTTFNFPTGSSYLLFQHYTGQIRQLVSKGSIAWAGGSSSDIIVGPNARNGTPLEIGCHVWDEIYWSHLFYIDTSNVLQDLVRSSRSDEWQKGALGDLHTATSESPAVGLQATCENKTGIDLRLFYGTKDNLVQELIYNPVNNTWRSGFSFAMSNGNSGIMVRLLPATRFMICLNSAYQLEIWWRDFNESSVPSPAHPVGAWTRGSVATNATVGHNSSLSWDGFGRLLYQDPSDKIVEIELMLSALHPESSAFKYHSISQDGREPLAAEPNTHIASYDFYAEGHTQQWVYYLQTNKSNIVEYRFEDHDYTVYNTRVVYAG